MAIILVGLLALPILLGWLIVLAVRRHRRHRPWKGTALRALAILSTCTAIVFYLWGALHLTADETIAHDRCQRSVPPAHAGDFFVYDVSFIPLRGQCRVNGVGTFSLKVSPYPREFAGRVPSYVNPTVGVTTCLAIGLVIAVRRFPDGDSSDQQSLRAFPDRRADLMGLSHVSRRTLLTSLAIAGTATAIPTVFPSAALAQDDGSPSLDQRRAESEASTNQRRAVLTGRNSRNGWEMEATVDNRGSIYLRPVAGVPVAGLHVRIGDVETVLVHLVRRFHYEVDQVRAGEVIGWHAPETVRASLPESNLASGTAVRIRPGHYPAGSRGNFVPLRLLVVRDILAELDGVVRWGGDDDAVDEALFYLDVPPGDERLTAMATKLRDWREEPGKGAGSVVDVMSPERRNAAIALEQRQRSTGG